MSIPRWRMENSCSKETTQPPNIKQSITILHIPIQRRVVSCQPYRVLTDVMTRPQVIVSESVVVQTRLVVLILTQLAEGMKLRIPLQVRRLP